MARKKATAMFKIVLVVVAFTISNVLAAPPTAKEGCIWCDYKTSQRFINCFVQIIGNKPLFQNFSPSDMDDIKTDLLAASKAIDENGSEKNNAMNVAMALKIGEIFKKQGATQNTDAETRQVINTAVHCYRYVYKIPDSDFLRELIAKIKLNLETVKNSSTLQQSDGIFDTDVDHPPKQLAVPDDGDNNFNASQGKNTGKQPPFGNGTIPQQQQSAPDQNNNQQNGLLLGQQQSPQFNIVPSNQTNASSAVSAQQSNGFTDGKQQPSGYSKVAQLQTTAFSNSKANSYSDQGTNLQNMAYDKQKPLRNGTVPKKQKTSFMKNNSFNESQNKLLLLNQHQLSQQQIGVSSDDTNSFYPVNPWNNLPLNKRMQEQKSLGQLTVRQSNVLAGNTDNSYDASYQKQQQFSPDVANSLGPWINKPQYGNQRNTNRILGQAYPFNNQPGQDYSQNYDSLNKKNIQPNDGKNSGYYPEGQRLSNQQYPGYGYRGIQYDLGNPKSDASSYNKSPDYSLIMPDSSATVFQKSPSFANDGASEGSSDTDVQKNDDVRDDSVPKQNYLNLVSTQQNIRDTKNDKIVNALKFAQTLYIKLYNSDLFQKVYNDKMRKDQILSVTSNIIYTALCKCGYSQAIALDIAKSSISFIKRLQRGCDTPTLAEAICKMLMINFYTKGLLSSKPDIQANTLGESMLVGLNSIVNPRDNKDKPVSLQQHKYLSDSPTSDNQYSGKKIFSFPDQQLGSPDNEQKEIGVISLFPINPQMANKDNLQNDKSVNSQDAKGQQINKKQTDADSFVAEELLKENVSSQKSDIDLTRYDESKLQPDGYKDSDSQKNIKIVNDTDAIARVKILMKYALKCINGNKFDYLTYSNVIAALVKYIRKTNTELGIQKTQLIVLIDAIFGLTQLLLKSDITHINQDPQFISSPVQSDSLNKKQNILTNYNQNSGYYPQTQDLINQQYPGYGFLGNKYRSVNANTNAAPYEIYSKSPFQSYYGLISSASAPQNDPSSFTNYHAKGSSFNTNIQKNYYVQGVSVPYQSDLNLDSPQENIPDTKDNKNINALKFAQTLYIKLYNSDFFKQVYNDKMTKDQVLFLTPYIIYTSLCNCGYSKPIALDIAKGNISYMKGIRTGCGIQTYLQAICKILTGQFSLKRLIGSKPDLQANELGDSMLLCFNSIMNPKNSNDKPVSLQPNGQSLLNDKLNFNNDFSKKDAPNKPQTDSGKSSDIDETIYEQPIFFDINSNNDFDKNGNNQATNLQNQTIASGADNSESAASNDQSSVYYYHYVNNGDD